MSAASQVDPHDKMRARDVNKVARGEQAPRPAHEHGTVSLPPPPSSSSKNDVHNNVNKVESSETAPADDSLPFADKMRHCYARYIEYHKCIKEKGKNAPECDKFAKYNLSMCSNAWIDKWNDERELGTLHAPI